MRACPTVLGGMQAPASLCISLLNDSVFGQDGYKRLIWRCPHSHSCASEAKKLEGVHCRHGANLMEVLENCGHDDGVEKGSGAKGHCREIDPPRAFQVH
eukprot:6214371-Pleurochrysis_carterae.AAC.8